RMGGICGGGDDRALDALTRYAEKVGLAFQIVDDCLDHTSSDEELGKRTQKDAGRGKLTYPSLMSDDNDESAMSGVARARNLAINLIAEARETIKLFESAGRRFDLLAEYILERKA
ncbi:MAG: polyprenyl synthetase family protein, partial [Planctomycetota bacterium]